MEPLSSEEARRRFRATLEGQRTPRRNLSVVQAKARFRKVDAELDIGPVLDAVARGQWRSAVISLVFWFNTDAGRAFIAPLMLKLLPLTISLFGRMRRDKSRSRSPAATAQKAESGA
jgi:hypothetical protein